MPTVIKDSAYSSTRNPSSAAGFCKVFHSGFNPVRRLSISMEGTSGLSCERIHRHRASKPRLARGPGRIYLYRIRYRFSPIAVSGRMPRASRAPAKPPLAFSSTSTNEGTRPGRWACKYSSARLNRAAASVASSNAHNLQRSLARARISSRPNGI